MRRAMTGLTVEDGLAFLALAAFAATTLLWGGHLSLVGA